eukprot:3917306-Prymnesium_polylepis.1
MLVASFVVGDTWVKLDVRRDSTASATLERSPESGPVIRSHSQWTVRAATRRRHTPRRELEHLVEWPQGRSVKKKKSVFSSNA